MAPFVPETGKIICSWNLTLQGVGLLCAIVFLGHLQVQHLGLGRGGVEWGALCLLVVRVWQDVSDT